MTLWLALFACTGTEAEPETPAEPTAEAPAPAPAAEAPAGGDTLATSAGTVTFKPVVHGTLMLDVAGKTVWVDPWTKGKLDGPPADVILVTDVHFDHLDAAAIEKVKKPETVLVAPAPVADELAKAANLADLKVTRLANGEKTEVAGMTVTAVPMYNLQRGPEPGKLYHDKGNGNGYLLDVGDGRIYISGDTECIDEMKALTDVDVAFVSMNLPYTMTPEEAAGCVTAFKPKAVYPYHYGESNLDGFEQTVSAAGVEVRRRNWYPDGMPF